LVLLAVSVYRPAEEAIGLKSDILRGVQGVFVVVPDLWIDVERLHRVEDQRN
jgi:hypothetical protein